MAKHKMSFSKKVLRFQFSGLGGVIGSAGRIEMYETIELLLSNRVLLSRALETLYRVESREGKRKKDVKAVILYECMAAISSGRSLSDALAPWVPNEELQLLRAGERSGNMVDALKDMSRIITAKKTIVGSVAGGAVYPIILMVMVTILLHQIATNMVPQFARIVPPETWTGAAAVLRAIADFVVNYGVISLVGLIGVFAWVLWSLPNMSRSRVRVVLDRIPPWSIYRMLHGSTFLLNIAVMLRAGIRVQEILQTMSRVGSPWLRVRIQSALMGIEQGHNLGVALHEAGYDFPDHRAVQFLRVLADQDGFDEKLANFGERWLEKSVAGIKAASGVILSIGIAITGILIMLILAGVVSIQSLAQQGNMMS